MLIAFVIHTKLQERRILRDKRPDFYCCAKKQRTAEATWATRTWKVCAALLVLAFGRCVLPVQLIDPESK